MDVIFRYDPYAPIPVRSIPDAETAIATLLEGNGRFADLVNKMQMRTDGASADSVVVPMHPVSMGLPLFRGESSPQMPFALVVGCSDARVPTESIFDQAFNSLFVVRIAGNVLGTECLGSIDYALRHLADSLRVVLVLGHDGCGAVSAAVDAYLSPQDYGEIAFTHPLRSLIDRIQISVRNAAKAITRVHGEHVVRHSGYRAALIEAAVYLNAAITAFDLTREVNTSGSAPLKVLYGVYDFESLRVQALPEPAITASGRFIDIKPELAAAPQQPEELRALATRIVEVLGPRYLA